MTPELMTYRECAAVLRVSDRTVYQLIRTGKLPAVKFNGTVRIDVADLRRFIESAKGGERGQ